MKKRLAIALLFACMAFGQSATPIVYQEKNFNTWRQQEPQALLAGPTTIATDNLMLMGGWISCAATARTFTIADGNAVVAMTAIPVAANQIVSLGILAGSYFPKGIVLSASGTGCFYHLFWRQ